MVKRLVCVSVLSAAVLASAAATATAAPAAPAAPAEPSVPAVSAVPLPGAPGVPLLEGVLGSLEVGHPVTSLTALLPDGVRAG
ncbi:MULTISPECIES: hypothetical protein [unclassified Streptomyces]|uniref:hypothetical protein n=1 Tax=unclassified Streptomyces TaxID=2593676 RepID=UPI0022383D22|nr:hypothetical protein [Streptomyces sp. SHP 1-2]MCW5249630.1 hypothetical protein [Streptomyces sp. SHP 1-2]